MRRWVIQCEEFMTRPFETREEAEERLRQIRLAVVHEPERACTLDHWIEEVEL